MSKKISQAIAAILIAFGLLLPQLATAQSNNTENGLALTITPPLIQLSLAPGQSWSSSIKVVNSNQYDLPLYATIALLEANGDEGQSKFTPVFDGDAGNTLANWIKLDQTSFSLGEEKSGEVPFTINVPNDAPPGGHYAAIIIGSQPFDDKEDGATVSVSSAITSLLFLRVAGDVVEKGDIREFTSEHNLYSTTDAKFSLRFENQGNVHIQPQGEITITNMWGKERGKIPINQKSRFGNVLPHSVRKFEFEWKSDWSPFEIGRYKAQVALSYGSDERQTVSSTDYFWVIPIKATLITLLALLIFILAVLWAIRRYIRRSLVRESELLGLPKSTTVKLARKTAGKSTKVSSKTKSGALPESLSKKLKLIDLQPTFWERMTAKFRNAPILPIAIGIIILGIIGIVIFFTQALKSERAYQVEVVQPDNKNVLFNSQGNTEEVQPQDNNSNNGNANSNTNTNSNSNSNSGTESSSVTLPVSVLNGTATTGLAGKVASDLKSKDVTVSKVGNGAKQDQTTISYNAKDKSQAEALNKLIGGKAELKEVTTGGGTLTLTVGAEYQ